MSVTWEMAFSSAAPKQWKALPLDLSHSFYFQESSQIFSYLARCFQFEQRHRNFLSYGETSRIKILKTNVSKLKSGPRERATPEMFDVLRREVKALLNTQIKKAQPH